MCSSEERRGHEKLHNEGTETPEIPATRGKIRDNDLLIFAARFVLFSPLSRKEWVDSFDMKRGAPWFVFERRGNEGNCCTEKCKTAE